MRLILIGDRQAIVESDQPLTVALATQLREQLDEALKDGKSIVLSGDFEVIDRRPAANVARLIEAIGNVTGLVWDASAIALEYQRLGIEAVT